MFINTRLVCCVLMSLLCAGAAAQQNSPPAQPSEGKIHLDVVVTQKSGPPVPGLQQQDFTVLDNKTPQMITSFRAVTGRDARVEVILVIDAVNTEYGRVAYEHTEVDKFLRADGGRLACPVALGVFTDKGIRFEGDSSTDGNALSDSLDRDVIGLREVGRSAGYFGAVERFQISLQALHQLVAKEASLPGRKVILWVSPGWPLLSGIQTQLDSKQQRQIFGNIVALSGQLLQARVTLYSIDPLSTESVIRESYYKEFVKGVSKPSQVSVGNLGLPVLALQSGGLALGPSNDIASLLHECVADTASFYEISFDAPRAQRPDEYHHLEIKLAKPEFTARTRQGYYAQP